MSAATEHCEPAAAPAQHYPSISLPGGEMYGQRKAVRNEEKSKLSMFRLNMQDGSRSACAEAIPKLRDF
jgi:hypothetical protein